MPTGHFTIGDLSFSFEGDLNELAHCQEIMRELRRAEQRLRRAAGTDRVVLIYDRNLEGERGTFDKMRLRTYDEENNYTLDVGVTDNNPLGIYVGYDQHIEVYNRESGDTWEIAPEGTRLKATDRDASTPSPPAGTPQDRRRDLSDDAAFEPPPAQTDAPTDGPSPTEIERAAHTLRARAQQHPADQRVGKTRIPSGPLGEKIKGFAAYCGRAPSYLRRVLDTKHVDTVDELTVGQVAAVLDMIADEEALRQNEHFEPDDELPF
jgi:hypothetical protein